VHRQQARRCRPHTARAKRWVAAFWSAVALALGPAQLRAAWPLARGGFDLLFRPAEHIGWELGFSPRGHFFSYFRIYLNEIQIVLFVSKFIGN
jgi:hypothetical protein